MNNIIADVTEEVTAAPSVGSTDSTGSITSEITTALLSTLCADGEGCTTPTAKKVRTPTPPALLPDFPPTLSTNKLKCTSEEASKARCKNGICFVFEMDTHRSHACHCFEGYKGTRCQLEYIPPFESKQATVRTAHIAAGLSVFILIIFVVLLALYLWHRLKRIDQTNNNTTECQPLNRNGKPRVELPALVRSCPVQNATNLNEPSEMSAFSDDSSKPTQETVQLTDVVVESGPTTGMLSSSSSPSAS